MLTEAEARAEDCNISEDVVIVGSNITHMTSTQNNMVLPAVCVVDIIIPPNIAIRVNMT